MTFPDSPRIDSESDPYGDFAAGQDRESVDNTAGVDDSELGVDELLSQTKSTVGPYIAAIVVFVLSIAGLIWFKFSREKPAPPTPVIQSYTLENKPLPPILDIPAPQSVAELTIAADAGSARSAASNPCAGPCQNTASAALQSAISGAAATARGCYEHATRSSSATMTGRIVVSVRVASSGTVCNASIIEDTLHSPQVASCVLNRFTGKRYQPFSGGSCVDVNVPLSFKPKEN